MIACKAVEDGDPNADISAKWNVVVSDFSADIGVTAYTNPMNVDKHVIVQTTTGNDSIDKLIVDDRSELSNT